MAISVTITTADEVYASGSSDLKLRLIGTTGSSKVYSVGIPPGQGKSQTYVRCLPAAAGDFHAVEVTYINANDGWILASVEATTPDPNSLAYRWPFNRWIKDEGARDNIITFTVGAHEDVSPESCPVARYAVITLLQSQREHSDSSNTLYTTITGDNGDSLELQLGHSFVSSNPSRTFARCLTADVGTFETITLASKGADGYALGGLRLQFQGAFYEWDLDPSIFLKNAPGDTPSITFKRDESAINKYTAGGPTASSCSISPCGGGMSCEEKGRPWSQIYSSDFSDGGADGWFGTSIFNDGQLSANTCGRFGKVLGAVEAGAGSQLYRVTTGLPEHTMVRLVMTLVKIDTFDGEDMVVLVNGAEVFRQTFYGGAGTQECGRTEDFAKEQPVAVDVMVPHTSSTLTVTVLAELSSGAADESFGVQQASFWFTNAAATPKVEDTFAEDAFEGWFAIGNLDPLAVSTCGSYGKVRLE
jgi:carrier protein